MRFAFGIKTLTVWWAIGILFMPNFTCAASGSHLHCTLQRDASTALLHSARLINRHRECEDYHCEQWDRECSSRRALAELRETDVARGVNAARGLRGTAEARYIRVDCRPVGISAHIAATAWVAFAQTECHADLAALSRVFIRSCYCSTACNTAGAYARACCVDLVEYELIN